ncbi:hypothetical protein FE782_06460 [Paenibacillus antri]|uniref:Uncharacterized protein n=1 Tax=Paenibacillus antri TaxID=2582848 RepID=A0A5R9GI04_9BACL|nr:hypothetical protein [Paenibacillus antri]TLS53008.1 hypothetical protein FE782_06460 [Paenibacillus antri]
MNDDVVVLIFVLLVFAVWGFVLFRRWLYRTPDVKTPVAEGSRKPNDEVTELLADHGYEVTHGKWKVSITVRVDDKELGSQMFVDYFAKKGDGIYVVKVAKARKPLDLTVGSAIRERLLSYALLYEETAGVLYVDVAARQVHQIRFELEL